MGGRVGVRVAVGLRVAGFVVGLRVGCDDVGLDVVGRKVVGGTPTQLPNVLVSLRRKFPPVATTIPSTIIVYEPGPKAQHMPSPKVPKLSLIVN